MDVVHKQFKPFIAISVMCFLVICSYFVYANQITLYVPEKRFHNRIMKVIAHNSKVTQRQISPTATTTISSSTPFFIPKLLPGQFDKPEYNGSKASVRGNQNIDISSTVQTNRIKHIQETCKNKILLRKNVYRGENSTEFYYSKEYQFAYCKVPKSGSTFWTQALAVLAKGSGKADSTFKKARVNVHGSIRNFRISFEKAAELQSVIVSRDPFSRLYSAFIDKVFLMLNPDLRFGVRTSGKQKPQVKRSRECALDVSFQDFLNYIIRQVRSGKTLDRHWAPIVSLCRPCDANTTYLVKQESFATDVEFIFNDLGVEEDKLKLIVSALHEHRLEYTVPGIIRTAFIKTKKSHDCISEKTLVERLWKSFQIQGYIPDNIELPASKFPTNYEYKDIKYVSEVFMETINANKMESIDSKQQRHRALVNAYRNVDAAVLETIRDIYQVDIAMFNYSDHPPNTY